MKYIITVLLLMGFNFSYSQNINPSHIINLCSGQTVQGTTPTTNVYNNLMIGCSTQPLSSAITLYYVEIESGSTFTFEILPATTVDFDFGSWLNPNLANLGPSDRGSQNTVVGINTYSIGLSMLEPTQLCEGMAAAPPLTGVIPGMVRWYDVVPGDGILIAIDHYQSSPSYNLSFGGDAVLNCTVIGKTYEVCDWDKDGSESFDLNLIKDEINNINKTFTIDFFEFEADANTLFATNTLSSPYSVSVTDNPKKIYARFKRANGLLARVTEIDFIVNEVAKLPEMDLEIEVCDFDQTKDEYFDFTDLERIIDNENTTQPVYKYYENEADAVEGNNNFITNTTNYLSRSKIIYIQITINGKCPIVVPLKLKVDTLGFPPKIIEYSEFCAEEVSDGLVYDLEKSIEYYLDEEDKDQYIFSFYTTRNNAINKTDEIAQPNQYKLSFDRQETIYVRIENEKECFIISELNLDSKRRIVINDMYNSDCEPYLLTPLPLGYNYFTEPNGQGQRLSPYSTDAIVYGIRTIYIYGNSLFVNEDYPDFNKCTYETQFTVYNNDCLVPKGISPNGDGLNDSWDLTAFGIVKLRIYNRLGSLVYSYDEGYTNQWHGQATNGSILPSGTYYFNFESTNGTRHGWVEVMYETK